MNPSHPDAPVRAPRQVVTAMALTSFAALSYEVTLTRVFSFVTWYHFVYMVIGLALLGYGAAGSLLTLRGKVTPAVLSGGAALFAVAGIASVLGLGSVAFDPAQVFLQPVGQILALLLLTLLVFLPFLGAGLVIGGILSRHGVDAGRIYAFDLVGAGLGCAATPFLLEWVGAPALAGLLSLLLSAGAWMLAASRWTRLVAAASALIPAAFLAVIAIRGEPELRTPNTKPYNHLRARGIGVDYRRWSALPRIDVSEPRDVPLFGFGGELSAKYGGVRWVLRGVFQDGTAHTAMLELENPAQIDRMGFLGGFVQGSAFPLRRDGSALVIGVGGGIDVLIALHAGLQRVVGVDINPIITGLLTDRYRAFTGNLAGDPRVELVTAEGRHFLSLTEERFDVIQLSGVDTFAALSSGAFALAEAYVYTVEAIEAFRARLKPGGILSYSRYLFDPPRETIRNASNMVEALARRGVTDARDRICVVAGKSWANCMLKPDGFTAAELAAIRAWAGERGFRLVYDPERPGDTAFDRLIRSAPAERRAFLDAYHYEIAPATDEWPFFFQYGKPSKLFSLEKGVSLAEDWPLYIPSGLATLLASLVLMAVLSWLLIRTPVRVAERRRRAAAAPEEAGRSSPAPRRAVLLYFAGLGLGFLFLEIALMQRFIVFLGNPTYALSVILFSLLASSGLGSALSRRLTRGWVLWLIPLAVVGYLLGLGRAIDALLGLSTPLRILFAVVAMTPLGLLLGMAFPLGIRALSHRDPGVVPWAFAVNACFTVLGSAGAVVLALLFGFAATFLAAAGVYLVAALAFRRFGGGLART
jgi:SAM-dependent methyltransferase